MSLTLVPGQPGTTSPAYGLVSTSTSFSVLDLSPEGYGQCSSYDSFDNSLFLVDDGIESLSTVCGENCGQDTTTYAFFGGIFGTAAVLLIVWYLVQLCCRRRRTKRQIEQVVVPASDELAPHLMEELYEQPPPPYERDPCP